MSNNLLLLIIGLYLLSKSNSCEFDNLAFIAFIMYVSRTFDPKKASSDCSESDEANTKL